MSQVGAVGAKLIKPAPEAFWGGCSGYFSDPNGFSTGGRAENCGSSYFEAVHPWQKHSVRLPPPFAPRDDRVPK